MKEAKVKNVKVDKFDKLTKADIKKLIDKHKDLIRRVVIPEDYYTCAACGLQPG